MKNIIFAILSILSISIFFSHSYGTEQEEKTTPDSSIVIEQIKKLFSLTDDDFGIPIKEEEKKEEKIAPQSDKEIIIKEKETPSPAKPEPLKLPPPPPTPAPAPEKKSEIPTKTPAPPLLPQQPQQKKPAQDKQAKPEEPPTIKDKIINFIFGQDPQERMKKNIKQQPIEKKETPEEPRYQALKQIDPENEQHISDSIKKAIENSPEVAKARIESELIKKQNTFTPIPTFQVGNDLATGKTVISAGIQLPLEPLFMGKQREKYGHLNIEQKKLEVERKVTEQYKTIASLKKKLESRQRKLDHARQLILNAEEHYKGGLIKLDELIKAKEILWNTENEVESITLEIDAETERLKSIERGGR